MNAQMKPETEHERPISVLCWAWLDAKRKEQEAKDARVAIEGRIIESLGFLKPEGSQTIKAEGFKVEFKSGFSYKLDPKKWEEVIDLIPDGLRPVKLKIEADEPGCRFLREKEPDLWKIAAQAITATPQKVGVKVSRMED